MMIRKMTIIMVLGAAFMIGSGSAQSLAEQCSEKLPQVMTCTAFASGKESSPQQKCCDSVKEMKESNPACLCFLIQQIHNGTNPALKSMNIQEARLLQLPSACKIANATITDCPKLLKLPPNSPEAAIFNNVTSSSSSTPTTPTPSSSSHGGFKQELATSTLLRFFLVFLISGGFGVIY